MSVQIQTVIDQKAFLDSVQKGINMANKRLQSSTSKLKLNIDDKGFRQPLGRITGDLKMFDSALAASNARVIAFGASTAVIGGISRAFKELAKSTIEVQKAFTDINRILNLSTRQFDKFGNQLFDIGKQNAAAFNDLTKAALEFSRQGLSTNEVLKRTSDALTLVRLTGINAEKAVSSLTATVNAFDGSMLTTTEALNKFVAVETKFAVGARDLVEALGRVGSSAQDAKVGFDELNAIVTSVQQTTGRGGAVIGNAMKTIFTRLQRQDTLDALESYGVAVRNVEGQTLPAIRILQNFSKAYAGLQDSSQSYLREQVAGVFQGNILSAVLKDLTKQTSTYSQALDISTGATNEASIATAKLNKDLAAMTSQAALEFKKLQENIGKSVFEPAARMILSPLLSAMESLNDLIDGEGAGSDIANGILKGIGNVLRGPGLAAALGIIGKVFLNTTGYILKSIPALVGITTETQKRANIESFIQNVMAKEASIAQSLAGYEGDIAMQAKILSQYAEMTAQDMERQQKAVTNIAMQMAKMPSTAGAVSVAMGGKRGRAAGGFIPGIAGEVHDIKRGVGGVSPSSKPVAIPNFAFGGGVRGTMIANTGEYIVPNYSNGGSAIFNPNMIAQYGMPAGAKPIRGASGYVPNFVDVNKLAKFQGKTFSKLSSDELDELSRLTGRDIGTIKSQGVKSTLAGVSKVKAGQKARQAEMFDATEFATMLVPQKGYNAMATYPFKSPDKIAKYGVSGMMFDVRGINKNIKGRLSSLVDIDGVLDDSIVQAANSVIQSVHPALVKKAPLTESQLDPFLKKEGAQGAIGALKGAFFEALIGRIVADKNATPEGITLDTVMTPAVKRLFEGGTRGIIASVGDFKSSDSGGNRGKFVEQVLKNRGAVNAWMKRTNRAAGGYIPNFAALGDAVEREVAAGVPLSSIRVNRSSKLVTPNNPAGLAVTNRRDEPNGLADVMRGARGYIPNFADDNVDIGKISLGKLKTQVGLTTKKLADMEDELLLAEMYAKEIATDFRTGATGTEATKKRIAELGQSLNMTVAQSKKLEANIMTAAKGGSMLSRINKMGGGMGGLAGGMILSTALPMAAGFVKDQNASAALTGAGTGAGIGMMFGPLGALAGAGIGGGIGYLISASGEAARELEKMTKELDDFNKETQQSVSAGEQYINSLEEMSRATTQDQLMDAQKRVAENFEKIKGTALEESFGKAGTNVEALTAALQKYEADRMRESTSQKLSVGLKEGKFLDIDAKRYLELQNKNFYNLPRKLGESDMDFLNNLAMTTKYMASRPEELVAGEKTLQDAQRRFSDLNAFFKNLTDEDYKGLSEAANKGLGPLADFIYNLGDQKAIFSSKDAVIKMFKGAFDENTSADYRKYFFENFKNILSGASEGAKSASDDLAGKINDAIESFAFIKGNILKTSREFEKVLANSQRLTKAEQAYVGQRANLFRGVGMGAQAVDLERQFSNQAFQRQSADLVRGLFNQEALKISEFLRGEGLQIGDESLRRIDELQSTFASGNIEKAIEGYREFQFTSKDTATKFSDMIDKLQFAYQDQSANIELDQAITNAKFTLESKKAKNLELEQRLNHEMDKLILKREKAAIQEDYSRQRAAAEIQSRLNDPATLRGSLAVDRVTTTQNLENRLRQIQQEGARAQALEQGIQKASEIFAQEQVVKSNYDLIDADQELVRALQELGNQLDEERFEADKQRQIRTLESQRDSFMGPIQFTEREKMDAQIKSVQSEPYKPIYDIPDPKQSNFIATQQEAEKLANEFEQIFSSTKDTDELLRQITVKRIQLMELDDGQNAALIRRLELLELELQNTDDRLTVEEKRANLRAALQGDINLREAKRSTSFMSGLEEGFNTIYTESETIFNRLGKQLPATFKDGMVSAMEAAMDKGESFGDAMRGVAIDMLRTIRRASLDSAMSNLTGLIGMGVSPGFRNSGNQSGGIIKARNGMYISGNRTGDRNPALLEDGEYVLNKRAVQAMGGKPALDNLNFNMAPRFATGGAMSLNEDIGSSRLSGFFLASDNPELAEAREKAREAYEEKMRKKAEKKALKQQLMSTLVSSVVSLGVSQVASGIANRGATSSLTGASVSRQGMKNFQSMGGTRKEAIGLLDAGVNINDSGIPEMRTGGFINSGFNNKDSIPAFLAGGEYVMNNKAVRKYGLGFMGRLNGGLIPTMQAGGGVGAGQTVAPLSGQSGSTTNNISINVNTGGGGSSAGDAQGNANADKQSGDSSGSQAKAMSERIKAAVLQVIHEEQRVGGSLSKDKRQG